MGSKKQASCSDTSSEEETDRLEKVRDDAATNTKRSYECTFCKRGFTNAQALGGHMNIHRKDRAKTKHVISSSSSSGKANAEYMNPNFTGSVSSEPMMSYNQVMESQRNYQMYFRPSGSSNPREAHLPIGNYNYNNYNHNDNNNNNSGNDHFLISRNEELGANLSLQIGSNHLQGNEMNMEVAKEDEVDLELRLGLDRHYIY